MEKRLREMSKEQKRKCYGFYVFKGNIDNYNNFENTFSNCFFDSLTGQRSLIKPKNLK